METAAIVNDRIAGTRITVYDVFYYLDRGRGPSEIAEILRLSPEQVQVAMKYIEEHRDEVLEVHKEIEERNARGNPPEIEARAKGSRERMQAWLEERRKAAQQERNGEGTIIRP